MKDVFVITGTRKGIGKELAEHYLSKGHIVVGCSRNEGSISHENYTHYTLDVADEKAVIQMIREVRKKHSKIDVLINNAGIASMNHILTTPYQTVQNIFQTNVYGTFLFVREVSKVMMKNNFGRIVNFTTVAAPLRLEGEAIYAASKAAVNNFTEVSSKELAQFGITVNTIGPTPIQTDLIKNVPKEKIELLLERQAIKRFGTFDDLINVINFYIDKKSNFITGQIMYLGGING
jgi:3-oxoacyl-[acyl-carrier protein] reductase